MKFTPNYTVSYKGVFHRAGETFEIDDKDAAEMQKYGKVEAAQPKAPADRKK